MNMAAILYNMGLPYQVIAVPVWGTLYLVGTGNDSIGWPDLKGRKIYLMGKGTTPDILFRCLLNSQGLDPDRDLQLDYSFPTHIDLANAVIAGKAPLAVISEPTASLALARNSEIREVMDLNKEWAEAFPDNPSLPQTAFVGRMDYIRDHPGSVRLICEAWARSEASVNENPAGAAGKIAAFGILPDSSVAIMAIPRSNLAFRYASEIRPMIAHYLHVFFTFNPDAIGGQMPDEKFIFEIPVH
jgi:NitT/TauT family transport system substrate-binding protein